MAKDKKTTGTTATADKPVKADSASSNGIKKTSCPLTRGEFRAHAKPIMVDIGGKKVEAEVKEFSTKSLGWFINGKTTVEVNGKSCTVQIGLNLTLVGSKELPTDDQTPE